MHRLLTRQLQRHGPDGLRVPEAWRAFVDAVDAAYDQFDTDRGMMERSLELSSEELLQTNSELSAVFQAFPDLFFRTDRGGTILDRKGGDPDGPYLEPERSLRGKKIQDVPLRDVARKFSEALTDVVGGKELARIEYSLEVGGGTRFYEARLLPLLSDQVMIIVRNISERKRAELALADKARELERSNAELAQFAYVASHDLQEPLRTVQSYLQLIRRRYSENLDDDANEFIDFAVEGAQRMRKLINDLLIYARVSSRAEPHKQTDLAEVVDDVVASLEAAISEGGGTVTRGELPQLPADAGQMRQLFQNLLSNALKFCRDRTPDVRVEAERQGSKWVLSVSDNGIGIHPDYTDKVFEIFKRLHSKEKYSGTGIGLAICKKIAERHGGQIWVESTPGVGSTFHIELKAGEDEEAG